MLSPATPMISNKAPADATAATPPPESSAVAVLTPLDPDARAGLPLRLFWYTLAFVVTSLIVVAGYRYDQASLSAPIYYDEDSLLILPMVKATIERGSHWRNERMGYPGVLELHDFPVVDHLHFVILWLLGRVFSDVLVVYNVYYLLTYPLAHLAAMAVMRHFRLSFPAAFVGGLVFAFMPYHYMRSENHYFLSAYWVVPFSLMAALEICRGNLPFFRTGESGKPVFHPWQWRSLGTIAIGIATASAGAYYAYFACAIFLASGLYSWALMKTWRAMAAACLLIGVTVAGGILNHFPTFIYQYQYGRNSVPVTRLSEEAEIYGLKVTHMVLPLSEHNWDVFAKIKSLYNTDARPLQNENERATLGLIGTAGLIGLMAMLVLPVRRAWPYGPLAALVGFSILVGTIGGFGSVFNHVVLNQVRCYNRISVYIAFLCYFATMWALDRWFLTRKGSVRWLRYPVFAGLCVLSIWDQTPYQWFRPKIVEALKKEADRFRADAAFYKEVETHLTTEDPQLGRGRNVFTLPFVAYPESDWTQKLGSYEHARGYIHTDSLVWSFGAMKGREVDAWQREVSVQPASRMLERLVLRGFDGLIVDKRGYTPKRANERIDEITGPDALGKHSVNRINHPTDGQVFFDLRPYRKWLMEQYGQARFDEMARREHEAVSFLWLHGFFCFEPPGSDNRRRWCSGKGKLMVVNPTDRERKFRIRMTLRADAKGDFDVAISGPLVQDHLTITKQEPPESRTTYEITVPPGRHAIDFRCKPPENFYSTDSRYLCFYVANFSQEEIE